MLEKFEIAALEAAARYIAHVGGDVDPHPQEKLLGDLRAVIEENRPVEHGSHYDFLDEHLDAFWVKATGKTLSDSWCAGIVSAHGDKGYGYRRDWERAGIHFYHGMMLYLLTYTSIMDRPKHESRQWVIDNYGRFKDSLPALVAGG